MDTRTKLARDMFVNTCHHTNKPFSAWETITQAQRDFWLGLADQALAKYPAAAGGTSAAASGESPLSGDLACDGTKIAA
jgi:hypothetical protein